MNHGFFKLASGSPKIKLCDCNFNAQRICEMLDWAQGEGVQALVLPPLCVTGSTCGDLFFHSALLESAMSALGTIVEKSRGNSVLAVLGIPLAHEGRIYSCAVAVSDGAILGIVPHAAQGSRHFSPYAGERISIELFGKACDFGTDLLFKSSCDERCVIGISSDLDERLGKADRLCAKGASIIAWQSAQSSALGAQRAIITHSQANTRRLSCAYALACCGMGESSAELVYGGFCAVVECGKTLLQSPPFADGWCVTDVDLDKLFASSARMGCEPKQPCTAVCFGKAGFDFYLSRKPEREPFAPSDLSKRADRCKEILELQAQALAHKITTVGARSVTIGVSGGLDSTLALIAAANAMKLLHRPTSDIIAVTMPCFGTSSRTRTNADKLCEQLSVPLKCIDVSQAVKQHFEDICHDISVTDVTFENSQARERTQVLMDLANKHGGFVLGTGDLSELALGWATYNGDHMSMFGINSSIPKTLMRHVLQYYADTCGNSNLAAVLYDILQTPISPELLPSKDGQMAQQTEDLVGPYELHDFFLYYALRYGYSPEKIYFMATHAFLGVFDCATILKWLKTFFRRFIAQQYKRSCSPDGAAVGSISLSPRSGFIAPSDASSTVWLNQIEKLENMGAN